MEKVIKNTITDIDGNTHNGIQIENQFWCLQYIEKDMVNIKEKAESFLKLLKQ
jgi:hypothetical protein